MKRQAASRNSIASARNAVRTTGSIVCVLAGAHAIAQTAPPSKANVDEAPSLQIEQVMVTARRREESLQDVPVSVSAFDARRIEDLQAQTISGLQNAVPNLYLDRGDGANTVIFIRGIGQNDSLAFADAGVGVYVDDVFIARSQAAFLDLFDVDRVEVLRGPQGTLYGRNTIGGAVKFVSAEPPEQLDAYLEAGGGNFDFATLKARVGGPLVEDVLRAKAAVSAIHRSGFATNQRDGKDDGDTESLAWRAALAYTPTDRFRVSLSADGKRDRPDTSRSPARVTEVTGFADPIGAPTTPTTFAPASDPYRVDVNANQLSDLSAYGLTLKAGYDLTDAWSIESITAYREMDFDLILDTDGSPLPILDVLVREDQDQFSQELRATYTGEPLTLVAGLYYFRDDDLTFSGVDNGSAAVFGFPVALFGFATGSLADTHQQTDSFAAFADASYAVTDRFSISAGLRYTYEEKESRRRFENFFDPSLSVVHDTPPFLQGAGTPGVPIHGKAHFDAVTPKLALSFQLSEDALLYASAARGFKSGGFDGRGTTDFGFQPFDPEKVWGYEAGLKSTWADGRIVANAAIFYNDYQDLQVTSFGRDPGTGTFVSLFTNAAKASTQGLELELAARPLAGLTVNVALGYLDAKYDDFDTLVGGIATDVSDRELVNAPEWTASLGITYERPLNGSLIAALHADAAYRDKAYTEITASELLAQDGYVMSNAFVAVKTADERWEVRGGVQNLGDEKVRVQGFNLSEFPGYQVAFYSARRTWDLHVIYRY